MEKNSYSLRNLGIAAIITTGMLLSVNKCEQNIQEKSRLIVYVSEKMSNVKDSWKEVYTKLGKEKEYLIKYSNSRKNPLGGLSKEEMIQYLELPSTVLL